MTAELSRFLLVRLERGLHPSRRVGIGLILKTTPGVLSITDVAAISPETLKAIMLAPDAPTAAPPHTPAEQAPLFGDAA